VTALQRLRAAPIRLAALAAVVTGAGFLALAVARGTVWAPDPVTTVHVAGQPDVAVVDTTPEALALDGPSVRVDVRAADPKQTVFVGVGRATDVDAYLGSAARTELTGVRGREAVVHRVGTDTSLPQPARVDVWALAVTGQGRAVLDWPQAEGRWRVVAAVDGATPPSEVVLTWQRNRVSSSVPALSAVGGLLLVLGLVGLVAARRRAAPAPRPAEPGAGAVRVPRDDREEAAVGSPGARSSSSAYGPDVDADDADDADDELDEAPEPAPFRQERRP
jgi:hypothetical protein